jgi:Ca-activated chloride channel family protein
MTRIHFSHPWFLLLAVVPVLFLALNWTKRKKSTHSVLFSGCDFLSAQGRSRLGISTAVSVMRCLALVLLVPVAAGIEVPAARLDSAQDSALVIVLDISSSMTADDFAPAGRLEEAKKHLERFVAGAPATEMGVVVFAGTPRLVVPVTNDYEAVRRAIAGIEAVGYGEDGTAIGTALASAVNRLRNVRQQRREILLITDGVNNSGAVAPLDAARLARALGVKINAVGMGGDSPSNYWVPSAQGVPYRMQARIEIDEKTLEQAASETGGSYARAKTSGELYRALASLGGNDADSTARDLPEDRQRTMHILALLGLGLICLGFVFSEFICPELPG